MLEKCDNMFFVMRGLRSVASFVIAHWHRDMYLSVTISFESGNSEGVCYKSAHLSSNRLLVSHTVSMNMFRQMMQSRLVLHLWTSVALDESALKLSWAQTLIDQDHIYLKSKHQWFQCFSTWKKPTVSYFCPWHAMAQRSKWPVSFWKTKASIVALGDRCGTPESRHLPAPAPCVVLAHFGLCPQPTFETSDRDLLASASVQLWGRSSLTENPQNQKQKKWK